MKPALPWFLSPAHHDFKTGCLALFSLPFLVGGLSALWMLTGRPVQDWLRTRSWELARAVIERAWLKTFHDGDGDSHQVAAEFRYTYQGQRHKGTRYSLADTHTSIAVSAMQRTVERLKPGTTVDCWVNPANPQEAVLDRSLPSLALFGWFFATPFLTVGVAGLGLLALPWLGRRFRAQRRAGLQRLVQEGALPPWVMEPFGPSTAAGKNEAALVISADERLPHAVGITLLNLFWNGLVGAFVCLAIITLAAGETGTGTFLSLFLLPFIAVGVCLVWIAVKLWRLTRRPGWVAALRPAPDLAGGPADFCWAWMNARISAAVPLAAVRIVARAAHWDSESESPARNMGRKRGTPISSPAAAGKTALELAAVDIPALDSRAGGGTALDLPALAHLEPVLRARSPRVLDWGVWWELEVTHRDGEIEPADLTQAAKLA